MHLRDCIELEAGAERFTNGLAVAGRDGDATGRFAVRVSRERRSAFVFVFVFDFGSNTQAICDGSRDGVPETPVVTRFPRRLPRAHWAGSHAGFDNNEGDDLTAEGPVQVL